MQRFFNSSLGVSFGLALGRMLPPRVGYRLSEVAAKLLSRQVNAPMVQAVRGNQAVVRGLPLNDPALDQAVAAVFAHAGRCMFDLYHNLRNPAGLKALAPSNPALEQLIAWSREESFGAFVVAPHLSSFDIVLLAAAYRGIRAQVLTYGNPTGGYKIQNEIRASTGLQITPVNPEADALAVENLRRGRLVVTAVDRPIRRKALTMSFFGRPAPLPAGHIRMALEANVPIIVVAAQWRPDEGYRSLVSEPIPLVRRDDLQETIRINGEAVLRVMEAYIRQTPSQWLMYYPVWRAENTNR